jgi:hypothetical protein
MYGKLMPWRVVDVARYRRVAFYGSSRRHKINTRAKTYAEGWGALVAPDCWFLSLVTYSGVVESVSTDAADLVPRLSPVQCATAMGSHTRFSSKTG